MPADTTGLLVVRAWLETGSRPPLRAEVRLTADVSQGIEETLMLTNSEAVAAVVRSWLEQIAR